MASSGQENQVSIGERAQKMQKVAAKAAAAAPALLVKRLSEHAVLPKRGSIRAAGYDLARSVGLAPVHAGTRRHIQIRIC